MGNKLKSQRAQLYDQRRDKILSSLRKQPSASTQKSCYETTKSSSQIKQTQIVRNPEAVKSVLDQEVVKVELENQRKEVYKMIYDNYNNFQLHQDGKDNLNDSISSTMENEEKELLAEKLCCNLDKYCKQIVLQLQTYNLEMKMEKITHQNWINFCQDLEKYNFLPKNRAKIINEDCKSDDLKASFSTLPIKQTYSALRREQALRLVQYSSSATNLDENIPSQSKQTHLNAYNQTSRNNQKRQSEEVAETFISKIQRNCGTKSSSISSFCANGTLLSFNTIANNQSQNSQDTPTQHNHNKHHYELTEEERTLKEDLKKFKMYMRESNEAFTMFRQVSSAFQQTFFRIYGKDEQKVGKDLMADPQLMEMRVSIEIMYIIRVFEQLIEKMMESFYDQQMQISGNSSSAAKRSMMQNMEFKAFPIINMLLSYVYKVFERIRYMMAQANKESTKKLKANMQVYIKDQLFESHINQMRNLKIPYQKSIEEFQKAAVLFRKNILSGVKYLQNVVKPTIMDEIMEQNIFQHNLKKQQSSSCLQSTTLISPYSLAEKSAIQFTHNDKLSLAKNNSIENCESTEHNLKQQITHTPIDEENEFYFKQESKIKTANESYLGDLEQDNTNRIDAERENSPISLVNQNSENKEFLKQQFAFGSEDLVPIYEYIISQVEMNTQDTLLYDLKLFILIFENIQDRVPSYSSQILNVSNILAAYKYLLLPK